MEPFMLSAADAAERLRRREFSPVTLVESCLTRIKTLEPKLRAWVTVDAEGALEAAFRRAKDLESKGSVGALHGIPVGIKDLFYTAGMRTTAGSKICAEFVPAWDATLVTRLKDAGAIVLGKTVTTEWAASDPPPTRNPWNPAHTPGGSSSGSAVAVAARMCPAATGTQTAGSIVRPAAYNGVVGLKPTYGRLSRRGIVPQSWSIDTPGILVRTVEDAALLLEVLAGHDPEDASTSVRPVPAYRQHINGLRRPPRLGLIRQFLEHSAEQVQMHMDGVAQRFREAGADVRAVTFPGDLALVLAAHWTIMKADFAAVHQKLFREHSQEYGPHVRGLIETGMLIPGVAYIQSLRIRNRFRRQAEALADSVDALLAPATGVTAPRIESPAGEALALPRTGDHAFQMPWSFAGLPVIGLPSGIGGDGLPLAIQLIGAPFAEEKLLAVARWCEMTLNVKLLPPLE